MKCLFERRKKLLPEEKSGLGHGENFYHIAQEKLVYINIRSQTEIFQRGFRLLQGGCKVSSKILQQHKRLTYEPNLEGIGGCQLCWHLIRCFSHQMSSPLDGATHKGGKQEKFSSSTILYEPQLKGIWVDGLIGYNLTFPSQNNLTTRWCFLKKTQCTVLGH